MSLPKSSRLTWSAIASVLSVQVVMIGFIISAMGEDTSKNVFTRKERKYLRSHLRSQVHEEAYKEPEAVPSLGRWFRRNESPSEEKEDEDNNNKKDQ